MPRTSCSKYETEIVTSSNPAMTNMETDSRTSRRLATIPQRDTSIERHVRRELFAMGLRFRTSNGDLPGSPDVANRRHRWAIFVHGCYWHHHDGCKRATIPTRNRNFWIEKFKGNRDRDQRAVAQLQELGYSCIVIWECEIKDRPAVARKKLVDLANHAYSK